MHNKPPRLVCVTNIPSSYRLYEFECLNEALAERGIEFEAIFMAQTEAGRHWRFRPGDWTFRSQVAWGLHPVWRSMTFHLNPGVLTYLLRQPPTWLLLGGGWNVPTVALTSAAARIMLPQTALLFWVEATLAYARYSRKRTLRSLKRAVMASFDAFVVPGQCSIDYIEELFGGQTKTCIKLANFVDEREYFLKIADLRSIRADLRTALDIGDRIALIWPARLIPEKGILEFLAAIAELPPDGFEILIAGDGPLHQPIQAFLDKRGMRHVRLLGHQDQARLLELYALSDVLLLPSPREPYGFVAVEALWAGLPLLLSDKVGAVPEVLALGKNGWAFDPYDRKQTIEALQAVLATGRTGLAQIGMQSLEIARDRFDGPKATRLFVDGLLDLTRARQP